MSHIFHLDDLLTQDDVDAIVVNTNVYTRPTTDLCATVDVCKTMVSSYENPVVCIQMCKQGLYLA